MPFDWICRINDNFCALLESGPKPTVAAVETMALGGGLEVAMACNARLCTPGPPSPAFLAFLAYPAFLAHNLLPVLLCARDQAHGGVCVCRVS